MTLASLLVIPAALSAQTLGDRAKSTTNQSVGNRMDQTINGGVDSSFSKAGRAIGGLFKKKSKKNATDPAAANGANGTAGGGVGPGGAGPGSGPGGAGPGAGPGGAGPGSGAQVGGITPTVNGAFGDFTPGVTTLFEDNFAQDALQDFPAKWNTNGSGKVVTIDGLPGRWLSIPHNSLVNPVLAKALPENCTVSFDLFLQAQGDQLTPYIEFGLTPVADILKEDLFYKDKFFVGINRYRESDGHTLEYGLKDVIGNKNDFPLPSYANKVLHIDLSINKTRIRVYADKTKLIDLPRALTPEMRRNFYLGSIMMVPAPQVDMLVSNLRIASAETDARSLLVKQLLEDGKAVTNDILFDVNSDVIKQASYPVIDQLGTALQQNASVRVLIVGHTDSDGAAAHNLDLSQKRSASVKNYLTTHFGIDASRLQSDGKGASVPVAPNTTEAGKAKNRRVEFVKL